MVLQISEDAPLFHPKFEDKALVLFSNQNLSILPRKYALTFEILYHAY